MQGCGFYADESTGLCSVCIKKQDELSQPDVKPFKWSKRIGCGSASSEWDEYEEMKFDPSTMTYTYRNWRQHSMGGYEEIKTESGSYKKIGMEYEVDGNRMTYSDFCG